MESPQHAQIEHNMTTHPLSDDNISEVEALRESFKTTAKKVADKCPDSREKSLAQTKLEEALMWAVAAIARE